MKVELAAEIKNYTAKDGTEMFWVQISVGGYMRFNGRITDLDTAMETLADLRARDGK